jgi:MGT family glycosyltransferase
MHYGIITPPVSGHIHPFGALGRELISRGHRVTLFQMEDLRAKALDESLEFVALGQADHPKGSLDRSLTELGKLEGLGALRFTIEAVKRTTEMISRDAPNAVEECGIDRLLVDQTEPAGGSVAEHLGIPFVTICNALPLNRERDIPPPFTPWSYSPRIWGQARNALGYAVYDSFTSPVIQVVNRWRKKWALPALQTPADSFSRTAQISQMVRGFDFPRKGLPESFSFVGPLRRPKRQPEPFPWEALDGRPMIYASLGTLQHGKKAVFQCFAEAAASLDAQLVIAHNGGLNADTVREFQGDPVAVRFAPQQEVLKRACLTLSHAGLNTVLDSLAAGVPLVATPITYEQPAIAARIVAVGAGISLRRADLTAGKVRDSIQRIMQEYCWRDCAARLANEIRDAGGVEKAASIIEAI